MLQVLKFFIVFLQSTPTPACSTERRKEAADPMKPLSRSVSTYAEWIV